ncbi:MAG: hypothetical protein ACHQ5A_14240, partial [Opitutales bacterium]
MSYLPHHTLRAAVAALCFSCVSLLAVAAAPAEAKKDFHIGTDSAMAMLKQFTAQSGVQLLYSVESIADAKLAPVQGQLTPREALEQMLAGTTLRVAEDPKNGALSLVRAPGPNAPSRPAESAAAEAAGARLADGKVKLDTFEVFDSKLINSDLPRSRDDVQPYVVFGKDQLANAPAANLEEFLRTRLPMNQAYGAASQVSANSTSSINLPFLHSPFAAAAATATGVKAGLVSRGDRETTVVAWAGDGGTFDIG